MAQFPFAHTITMTYRVSDGALEVRTRLDNLSTEPMPVVIGYHPIFELPDGNRDDWTVSVDAETYWIEIPQRLPTGETCASAHVKRNLSGRAAVVAVLEDLPAICSVVVAVGSMIMIGIMLYNHLQQ